MAPRRVAAFCYTDRYVMCWERNGLWPSGRSRASEEVVKVSVVESEVVVVVEEKSKAARRSGVSPESS